MTTRPAARAALLSAACGLVLASAVAAQSPCGLPIDPGPCDGACPRWAHDPELGACVEFTWGCCGGNENNFETLEECEAACASEDPCSLPPDPGPCDGVCPRWYHDAEAGECREFTWGCCGGNENNFETLEECEAACGDCEPPAAPGLLFVARDGDDLVLTWGEAATADAYHVHRDERADPRTWGAPHAEGVTDSDPARPGVQHRDRAALLAGPRLHYLVSAVNACGESPSR